MRFAPLVLVAILLVQPAGALSSPVIISYGRSWPQSIVVDPKAGLVYVDATSGIYPPTGFSFGVINATSHSVIKTLPLDVTPGALAFDEARDYVYVAGSDTIEVFYSGTGTFIGNISIGRPVLDMASNPLGNLYATSGGNVYEIAPPSPTAKYSILANASVGAGAGGLAVDPSNHRLYVADYLSDTISVFNYSGLEQIGTITMPSCCPSQLALNPDTQMLYVVTGTNNVDLVNAGTDSFVRSVQVAQSVTNSTSDVAIDPGTGAVFISFSSGDSIAELSQDGGVIGFLRVTSNPAGMAVDSTTGELYVTNYHQVTVLDARGNVPSPSYTVAAFAALGAVVAVAALLVVLRSSAWRNRRNLMAG